MQLKSLTISGSFNDSYEELEDDNNPKEEFSSMLNLIDENNSFKAINNHFKSLKDIISFIPDLSVEMNETL